MTGRDVRQFRIGEFIADGLFIGSDGTGYPGYGVVRVFYGNGEPTPLQFGPAETHLDGDLSVGGRIIGLLDCLSNADPLGAAAVAVPGTATNVSRYDHQHPHQAITISGDATATGTTALTLTLATVNQTTGSFGGAAKAATFTVDGKGRVTTAGEVAITPATIGAPPLARAITGGGILAGGGDLTDDRVISAADVGQDTVLGRTAAGPGAPSALSAPMVGVITAADAAAARSVLSLGDAALRNVGAAAGNLVALAADGALPALSGAALTGVSAVPASAVITTAVNLTLDASHNSKAVVATAALTVTMPAASGLAAGWSVRIKPAGGDVTVTRAGGDTIDGGALVILPHIGWGASVRSYLVMAASPSSFIVL